MLLKYLQLDWVYQEPVEDADVQVDVEQEIRPVKELEKILGCISMQE